METNSSLPESFDMISSRVTARRVVKSSSLLKSKSASTRPSSRELAVVVPCYNEAKRLNVKAFLTFLSDWPSARLVFVNDGSGDQTLAILNYMRAEMPERINVIDLVQNSGKAEAVRQGLLFASQRGDQLIAYWDADLATPLDALIDFTRIASGFNDVEVVFGSRRRMLGHRIERTVGRRIISRACSTLARLALRLPIADTQCGAKLLRNSDALRAAIAAPFTAGWLFDVELFARIADRVADRRFAFYEMPLAAWTEISGSKVSARAVLRSGFQMLALIARNRLGLGRVKATPAPAGLARLVAVVRQDEPSNVLLLSQAA